MPINKALAEYLELYHKGEANAVTSRELECAFRMRGSESCAREINALRGDGIPICSFDGGYYYAATEELRRTIRQLRSRIKKIAFAERGLSRTLPDYGDTRFGSPSRWREVIYLNSFIPWVGGKGKLLWIINKLMPDRYTRFIDVFGGSGTVTMCRPIQRGCMEVYNDFGNLTNLFCCVKNRPMALLAGVGIPAAEHAG